MGKVVTPVSWGVSSRRPRRTPVPLDGWEPVMGQIVRPVYQRTGWAPVGMLELGAAADSLGLTPAYLSELADNARQPLWPWRNAVFVNADWIAHLRKLMADRLAARLNPQPSRGSNV